MKIVDKIRKIIQKGRGKILAKDKDAKKFLVVYDEDEDILWIGKPSPETESVLVHLTNDVMVEMTESRAVRSIALLKASTQHLLQEIFYEIEGGLFARDPRYVKFQSVSKN